MAQSLMTTTPGIFLYHILHLPLFRPKMTKTSQVLTSPLAGTVVTPVYNYTEEQQAQIRALREVRSV